MRIAVIGSGISGLGAAWALGRRHDVTLYEAEGRLGGHANTVEVPDGGRSVPVDTGFIVYNERNYPNLVRLFEHLGVPTEPSEMSFSVSRDRGAFEYKARALGLLAQPSNLVSPGYLRMVRDIGRFTRGATAALQTGTDETTGEFLDRMGSSPEFRRDFLLPMVACIWSSSLEAMLAYPATSMVRFLDNHGLLDVLERPRWRTVSGGSREYVSRIAATFEGRTRLASPVRSIVRTDDEVAVHDLSGDVDRFDHVVLAAHADTSLEILGPEASAEEREVLSAFGYQENRAVLHRDPALMPRRRRAWSSWNYLAEGGDGSERVSLSYWMNRLQNLRTERPVIVTLNPSREPRHVEREITYHHPRFDARAVRAQGRIGSLQGARRTWFCGSYLGYGFHEDGLRAGLEVASALGAPPPWQSPAEPATRVYATMGAWG
ncbi:MAG: NAD(P)/FAD-dependent oxidoreductase [Planctomycetaceae bacterium]